MSRAGSGESLTTCSGASEEAGFVAPGPAEPVEITYQASNNYGSYGLRPYRYWLYRERIYRTWQKEWTVHIDVRADGDWHRAMTWEAIGGADDVVRYVRHTDEFIRTYS